MPRRYLGYSLLVILFSGCVPSGGSKSDPNLTCETKDGLTECECAEGWVDDGAGGCIDQDECATVDGACDPNASCTNLEGSFSCECDDGWVGDGASCTDIDECAEAEGLCGPNEICKNTPGAYTCVCDEGYEDDGETCTDVNECEADISVCDSNATCTNNVGGFECTCQDGWEGEGQTCTDVNECEADISVCGSNATCTNTDGGFECACQQGWEGDGQICTDIDECLDLPCDEHASCTNTDGAYECLCDSGWEGDGKACTDVDECAAAESPCDVNSDCINTTGAYECVCYEGWEWNGSVCIPVCGDGICQEGETCQTCGEDCATYGASEDTTTLDDQEQAFLVIINEYRAQNGLGTLAACRSLNRAAQGHSEDMRDQNYFSHDGLDGSSPWDRACGACYELGCGPKTAMSENLAAGNQDAQSTFIQWKNSPGHNKNMLGPSVSYIGIGRATGGGQYGVYWTNVFGGQFEQSCE